MQATSLPPTPPGKTTFNLEPLSCTAGFIPENYIACLVSHTALANVIPSACLARIKTLQNWDNS